MNKETYKKMKELEDRFIIDPTEEKVRELIRELVEKEIQIVVNYTRQALIEVMIPSRLRNKDYWRERAVTAFHMLVELNMLKKKTTHNTSKKSEVKK